MYRCAASVTVTLSDTMSTPARNTGRDVCARTSQRTTGRDQRERGGDGCTHPTRHASSLVAGVGRRLALMDVGRNCAGSVTVMHVPRPSWPGSQAMVPPCRLDDLPAHVETRCPRLEPPGGCRTGDARAGRTCRTPATETPRESRDRCQLTLIDTLAAVLYAARRDRALDRDAACRQACTSAHSTGCCRRRPAGGAGRPKCGGSLGSTRADSEMRCAFACASTRRTASATSAGRCTRSRFSRSSPASIRARSRNSWTISVSCSTPMSDVATSSRCRSGSSSPASCSISKVIRSVVNGV